MFSYIAIVEISPGNISLSSGDVINITCTAILDINAVFMDLVWRVNMTLVNDSTEVISKGMTENGSRVYAKVLQISGSDEYNNVPITCLVSYNETKSLLSSPIFITVTGKLE